MLRCSSGMSSRKSATSSISSSRSLQGKHVPPMRRKSGGWPSGASLSVQQCARIAHIGLCSYWPTRDKSIQHCSLTCTHFSTSASSAAGTGWPVVVSSRGRRSPSSCSLMPSCLQVAKCKGQAGVRFGLGQTPPAAAGLLQQGTHKGPAQGYILPLQTADHLQTGDGCTVRLQMKPARSELRLL